MESCLKFLPRKSYNTSSLILLTIFGVIGVLVIGIASDFESKETVQCNPDKTIASDLSTRKFIDTQCFLKYTQKFYPYLPLHNLFMINFGLVLLLSIIYAYSVKHRVEIFANPSDTTLNAADDEIQPCLSGMSEAASDPLAYQRSGRYFVFTLYIAHLIVFRAIPSIIFAVLLLNSSNFPIQFHCQWPTDTKSTSHANFTRSQMSNYSTVDCTYPMGSKNEKLTVTVITINFFYGTAALTELAYLLWSAWKDRTLCTDMEFCCVYLLRKRKRIRKLINKIRNNVCKDIFYLHDDFGENSLSRRRLEEIYVNVIIQEGRESTWSSRRKLKNRHEIYEAHFTAPANAITLTKTEDLFKRTSAQKNDPKTVLVVGRPGIGKTLLTKKLFYQWQQQVSHFWHGRIVILIRFRVFNNKQTSLHEMLRLSDGFNMSTADFNSIYEYICLMPSNVILVFDGLDELKVDDVSFAAESTVNSHNDVTHVLPIFKQLVKGKLLPGVTVITTSRPTAEHIYCTLEFDRQVELLGFNEEKIKDYVEKFCCNDIKKSAEIWNEIKQSPELLSLCYIPVNSYIVCLTLKESIDIDVRQNNEGHVDVPKTVTELYNRAIKVLLFKHNLKYKDKKIPKDYFIAKFPEELQSYLNKLKEIARIGMINDQLIFEFSSDDEFLDELSNCGVFNKLADKRHNMFCFLHLTIQEFLAALHVVDDIGNVESFLVDHMDNPKWHLVIQFVSGLIGDKKKGLMELRNTSKMYVYMLIIITYRKGIFL